MESLRKFSLPSAPAHETGPVKAWVEAVVIPTYEPMPPDRNPMFFEKRVYQGSSGKVYPLPFTDRISTERTERAWRAVHLENEYLRVMVLPEIGGRIHVGLDKTNGYDFFYRQNVIKPALVGLTGPWISGGVEFNWPQHHRPATFMPVSFDIEEHEDGSRTVWCSDHDPMSRMKGMHGVCLHPGGAYIELKARLYNRTQFVQSFLWWANVAVRVHENYQSFFPPDVRYVADHAKRAISEFPLCHGCYYGVDYETRAKRGVPPEERPRAFVPPGDYAPNDLSWYANIPVPTSYMAVGSEQDFFGGYDHALEAGFIHFANHHIAPGKKQWTWGNHEFGYAWDRNLTDTDGPYVELMAGVYTDNQPDFSFLTPGETKIFSQYWYPIQKIGPAHNANLEIAVSLHIEGGRAHVGVSASRAFDQAVIALEGEGTAARWTRDLKPGTPFLTQCRVTQPDATLRVLDSNGGELIRYAARPVEAVEPPGAATEPPLPEEIENIDELLLTGLHLEQYRHATRQPEAYWSEALRRDKGDARCNNALGLWHLRRGEFEAAERHFRAAIKRLTLRNPNPYDGEPFYNLGLTLRYMGRDEEAYGFFFKATWNQAWRGASYHAIAELEAKRGDWPAAAEHLQLTLAVNRDNLRARNLLVVALRNQGHAKSADDVLRQTLKLDRLDVWANELAGREWRGDNQVRLDLAIDYARAGLYGESKSVLESSQLTVRDGSVPMVYYTLGHFYAITGEEAVAREFFRRAADAVTDYCFPSRLEELLILEAVARSNPEDSRAHFYLGCLLYDKRRYEEGMEHWEAAAKLDAKLATAWRNLGIGYYNTRADAANALRSYEKAFQANPADARVFYERDQLFKRTGVAAEMRLAELERHRDLVALRDDLSVELAALYNQTGKADQAGKVLTSRQFQPWEGGEGLALTQHVRSHLALGREALSDGRAQDALRLFEAALKSPANLGEAKHLLANQSNVYFWLGAVCSAMGQDEVARAWWTRATQSLGDFQEMSVKPYSEMTLYNAMALRKLGRDSEAERLLTELQRYAVELARQKPEIDYFATSLPAMLLFNENLQERNQVTATFLRAQAALGLGEAEEASRLLDKVLTSDPNHAWAWDLRQEMSCEAVIGKRMPVRS
jgi:tetratricopeptide (TPR) repeat protein